MIRQPVQSSNLRAVGYDKGANILEIEFIKGGTYLYFDVPESTFLGLMEAASKGTYFHEHIRGFYRYKRLD